MVMGLDRWVAYHFRKELLSADGATTKRTLGSDIRLSSQSGSVGSMTELLQPLTLVHCLSGRW
jgi:hypothetical protein